jgi:hypothetical protein
MAQALDKPAEKKAPAKADADAQPEAPRGWLSWVVGWVLVPAAVIGLIWGGGLLLGVHNHDGWFTRLVLWIASWF